MADRAALYVVLFRLFREGPVDVAFAGNPLAIAGLRALAFAALDQAEGYAE
jgi:hypothetical protein